MPKAAIINPTRLMYLLTWKLALTPVPAQEIRKSSAVSSVK